MPTVQPPPPPPPAAAQPQPTQSVAVAVKAPDAISQLSPGQTVQATVQATAQTATSTATGTPPSATQSLPPNQAPNQVQVQTALGPITLQTALAIPKGAVLSLVLTQQTTPPQFVITQINAKPVPGAQAALKSAGRLAQGPVQTVTPTTPLTEGARLSASLVRPASFAPAAPPAAGAPQAPAGSGATPPPQSTLATPPAPANPTSSSPAASAPSGGPIAQSTQPGPNSPSSTPSTQGAPQLVQLPSGTRFAVSIVRIDAPSAALNTPSVASSGTLTPGATLNGTVSGTTPQGQPIVQTPHATIALETTAKVAEGARVIFKVETAPIPPSTADAAKLGRSSAAETLVQAKSWPQLDEALKVLAQVDPARFDHVAQNALPQPGAKLTSQMLFFLSALKGGDIKAWIGDTVSRVIDRDRPGLMNRLSGDFQLMSRLADDPQSGDWRLALIPLWNSGALEQLRMYYRNNGGQGEDGGEADGTRFILDIELSNIGHLQMDGLMKSETKRLDLIVRTDIPLPETWRVDIADIFVAAQDITGLGGGLAFQAAPGHFVEFPPLDTPAPHPGLLV